MSGDGKFFLGVLAGAAILVGIIVFFFKSGGSEILDVSAKEGWKTGGSDTVPVKIVEFGDFQCPGCQIAAEPLRQAVESRKTKAQLSFLYFPLTSSHRHAMSSSLAAEAAGEQGKFWEMYDKLYATQSQWSNLGSEDGAAFFRSLAEGLKLNMNKYDRAVESIQAEKKINGQLAYGTNLGVDRTPTFFVNGKKYTGARTVEQWQKLIDEEVALAKKDASGSQSTSK